MALNYFCTSNTSLLLLLLLYALTVYKTSSLTILFHRDKEEVNNNRIFMLG